MNTAKKQETQALQISQSVSCARENSRRVSVLFILVQILFSFRVKALQLRMKYSNRCVLFLYLFQISDVLCTPLCYLISYFMYKEILYFVTKHETQTMFL